MMNADEDIKMIESARNALGEHFDSVHIFCTRYESGQEDGTIQCNSGVGNWFARYGQINYWLIKENEKSRLESREDPEE